MNTNRIAALIKTAKCLQKSMTMQSIHTDWDSGCTSKLMMKMFISALKAKRHKTEAEKIQLEMMSKSYDISDKKYIEPIIDWANHYTLREIIQ